MADTDTQYPVTWTHRKTGATRVVYNKAGEVAAKFDGYAAPEADTSEPEASPEGVTDGEPAPAPTAKQRRQNGGVPVDQSPTSDVPTRDDAAGGPDPDPTH